MKPITASAIALVALAAIMSCNKKSTTVTPGDEHLQATISITSPYAGQVFKYGDTIKIAAEITSKTKMHGCNVLVLNRTGDTLFSGSNHDHGTTASIRKEWINDLTASAVLDVKLICIMDHDGHTCEQTQTINIQNK